MFNLHRNESDEEGMGKSDFCTGIPVIGPGFNSRAEVGLSPIPSSLSACVSSMHEE